MSELVGRTTPRLYTDQLTGRTLGDDCIAFAEQVLGENPDPWQRWLLCRALELAATGDWFRFRVILLLVSRQNGKTWLLKTIILWIMFTRPGTTVLGVAQSTALAREVWAAALETIERLPHLEAELRSRRMVNGEQELKLSNGSRYLIRAANRTAGRGLSVDLLVMDELREQRDWDAWAALSATTSARPGSLTICASNAGDDQSVVLNSLRENALAGRTPSLGLFEWSAPDGCELDDLDAILQANPSTGYGRLTLEVLQAAIATDPPAAVRTERLCQRVDAMDNAIDAAAWRDSRDSAEIKADARLAAAFDISPDGAHATLVVAELLGDGRIRVAVAKAWRDTRSARAELPGLLDQIKPVKLAYYPAGPGAAFVPLLERRTGAEGLGGARVTQACQGLADLVSGRQVLHNGDALLDAQIAGVSRLVSGDGWRFQRKGTGHADAAYAAAGAVLLVQDLPPERPVWERLVI